MFNRKINKISLKLAIFLNYYKNNRFNMKNYKFYLIILGFFVLASFLVITYLDMPAPDKIKTQVLDVNDNKVK